MTLYVSALIVLLFLSGFFSGVETAFTSLSPSQLHSLKERLPKKGASVEKLLGKPDRLLSTILIGNNLVNVSAASLATVIATRYFGEYGPGIATGLLTLMILVFGEVTPKQLSIAHNEFVVSHTAQFISVLEVVFLPLVVFVSAVSNLITRLSGGYQKRSPTPEGILSLVRHAAKEGVLSSNESWLVKNVFRFHEVTVSMIMTHRTKVFSLERTERIGNVLSEILAQGVSRFPVYDKDPEKIVGVVLVKELAREVAEGNRDTRLKDLMMSPIFVPENRKIHTMLTQFRSDRQHLAIVLDEYGGLAGIVTLEDVIEEIFGEIYDENDRSEQEQVALLPDGSYRIAGDTPLYAINDRLSTKFPHTRNIQTIGGYVSEQLGRIPQANEQIETDFGRFTVDTISRKHIVSVRFEPIHRMKIQESEKKV